MKQCVLKAVVSGVLLLPTLVFAKGGSPESAGIYLAQACKEYIEIYDKRDEERFAAFLTTSSAEAFRAGYCLGVVLHVDATAHCNRHERIYGTATVYQKASAIAKLAQVNRHTSESEVIQQSLCQ